MTFRLACADFAFPLMTHDQSMRLISMLGFTGIDIGLFEGRSHLWPSQQFANIPLHATELKQRAADLGLEIADLFLQMAPDFQLLAINHPDEAPRELARERFKQLLEFAAHAECRHVTALPGVHFPSESYEDSFARSVDELTWRVHQAQSYGIVFGTEPHVGSIVDNPASALRLVEATHGLTVTLDYTHFARAGLPDSSVEPLLKHASHFHVRGAAPGRLQVSFQKNTIDYQRIADQFAKMGYRGWIGIEYIWIDWEQCNECDNISETIQFRDFFQAWAPKSSS